MPRRHALTGAQLETLLALPTAEPHLVRHWTLGANDLAAFAERAGYEVVGVYKETASGVRHDRAERRKVMALAQRREIDAVLVTELSRWGRSTTDLLATLRGLEARRVSLVALNGMAFDLSTPHGRMMATVLAGIA